MLRYLPAQPKSSLALPLGRSLAPVRSQLIPSEPERLARSSELNHESPAIAASGHSFATLALHSNGIARPHELSPAWIQPKLTIGAPGDRYEQEADRVAQQVVQQLHAPTVGRSQPDPTLQRQPQPEDEKELQRKPIQRWGAAIDGRDASPDLTSAINRARGGGQSLAAGLQQSMGQAMGADFSGVRVHTDAQSDQLNQSIQAKAFTTGQDVFFRQGAYQPRSRGGQELIAHELTHVVQQQASEVMTPRRHVVQRGVDVKATVKKFEAIGTEKSPDQQPKPDIKQEGDVKATIEKFEAEAMPIQQIAQEIYADAVHVDQAGAMMTLVKKWKKTIFLPGSSAVTHDPATTLEFMMTCKALSTNQQVADLLKTGQSERVKQVVVALTARLDSRQIIQQWAEPSADIAVRGDAWDIFLTGVAALSNGKGDLDAYLNTCLAHDKGYGQIYLATQNYLLLGNQQAKGDSFDTVLNLMLAESSNSNIWLGGQKESGKISTQLNSGFVESKRVSLIKQEQQMWSAVVTSLITVQNPGKPDWTYARTIRENEDVLFAAISAIVPKTIGTLHMEYLNEALELMSA
jgi:hypothetical protein